MSAIDEIIKVYAENVDDSEWVTEARAELAQLRADLQAAQERIAYLTSDIGESGLAAINRLIAACERGDGIDQHCAPDLSIARDEIVRQAEQLRESIALIENALERDINGSTQNPYWQDGVRTWLAANVPAPQAQPQEEQRVSDDRIDRMLDKSGWESDEVAEV